MKLLHTCAEESSVHGLHHLVAKNRHWLERLFWTVIIICSLYSSYAICLTTWERYQKHPIVLTLQTDYRNWIYRPPAVTICPSYINELQSKEMIHRLWNITEIHAKFNYYNQYLHTIANATYNNLVSFVPFEGDASLDNVDMLEAAWTVRRLEFLPSSYFQPVITEMGMCFSSSNFSYLQNASSTVNYRNRTWPNSCSSFDYCKSTVVVSAYGKARINLYVHTEDEVMTATDTISSEMGGNEQVKIALWVDQIVASSNLKHISPVRRKCIYQHETSSNFRVHTPQLCKIDCRIKKALKICNCIPFFYNIAHLVKCNASGMVCLSRKFHNWYDASCPCMEQCESTKFTQLSISILKILQLNNQLSVEMFFPKRRIKRSVLFNLSDLVVSFGGAAALFLGSSFLSAVEFLYFFLEYIGITIGQFLSKH
ncbi:sodium channel protein Nach-like [Malaya genurostris]|uniref:sodium channel protein Nach-like n=1 Tax=Malaya genurostris TaxID=325434 RepID=UPI0026F3A7F3|nr:sodium channel protein Nach-like [Malaya genurostris]